MRVFVLAVTLLLAGCTEADPNFAVTQWFDGAEDSRPTAQILHTEPGGGPGRWARTQAQAAEGDSSWYFSEAGTYPALCDGALLSPEFEAGSNSLLRFAYWMDMASLSVDSTADGAVIQVKVESGEWTTLEPNGGYTHTIDPVVLGSQLPIGGAVWSGNQAEWVEDYVEFSDAEPGDEIQFRFRVACDISGDENSGAGFFVDDVEYFVVE